MLNLTKPYSQCTGIPYVYYLRAVYQELGGFPFLDLFLDLAKD